MDTPNGLTFRDQWTIGQYPIWAVKKVGPIFLTFSWLLTTVTYSAQICYSPLVLLSSSGCFVLLTLVTLGISFNLLKCFLCSQVSVLLARDMFSSSLFLLKVSVICTEVFVDVLWDFPSVS